MGSIMGMGDRLSGGSGFGNGDHNWLRDRMMAVVIEIRVY
jgi:hypothetical protein